MLRAVTHFMTCASADKTCSFLYPLMCSIRAILSPMISLTTNKTISAFFRLLVATLTISAISFGIFDTKWASKKLISLQPILSVFKFPFFPILIIILPLFMAENSNLKYIPKRKARIRPIGLDYSKGMRLDLRINIS